MPGGLEVEWLRVDACSLATPDTAVLEEAWRRAMLAEFVHRGWIEEDEAAGMLAWPHSGFGAYVGSRIEGRESVLRVATSLRTRSNG